MLTLLFLAGAAWCAYWLYKLATDRGHRTSASPVKALCSTCKDALTPSNVAAESSATRNRATNPTAVKPLGAVRVATAVKPVVTASTTKTATPDYLTTTTKVFSSTTTVSYSAASRTAANDSVAGKPSTSATSAKVVPLFKAPTENDNLKTIKGIGVVMEKTLNDLGITTFKQLAEFQQAEVKMVSDKLSEVKNGFGDRIERDDWVEQAKGLVKKAS